MKPVHQAKIDSDVGDCWRCCIASVLELDRDEVPNFAESGAYAHDAMQKWVSKRGLAYVEFDTRHWRGGSDLDVTYAVRWDNMLGVHAIATVPSQRFAGACHSIVIRWEPGDVEGSVRVVVAHDPNPDNQPYNLGEMRINHMAILVPLDYGISPRLEAP